LHWLAGPCRRPQRRVVVPGDQRARPVPVARRLLSASPTTGEILRISYRAARLQADVGGTPRAVSLNRRISALPPARGKQPLAFLQRLPGVLRRGKKCAKFLQ